MRAFVKKYVEGCDTCARKKHAIHPRSTTRPLEVPHGPWESVGVDLITQLPKSQGYDAIIVFTDHFSKQIHALPCMTAINAETVADIYYREIFRLHGLPLQFVSDRGPQFGSQLLTSLLNRLGIRSNLTTSYNPQANGQTERANQEVEKYLRLYVANQQDDWATHLPMAEFVINSRVHTAHGLSPFEAIYGYSPHFNIPVGRPTGLLPVDERVKQMQKAREDVEAGLRLEKERQKREFEEGKKAAHIFEVGDYVWLDSKKINIDVPTRKLGDLRLGPYKVLERRGDLSYRLELPKDLSRLHDVFHVDKLTPWKGNDVNGILPPPPEPVVLEDGELEYEVEEILNSAIGGRAPNKFTKYRVKWRGYDASHNTWEPESNLEGARELIEEFHQRYPKAPRLMGSRPIVEERGEEAPLPAKRRRGRSQRVIEDDES